MATFTERPMMSSSDILGHPRGLFMLFFVEMWERFSYYGMKALLVLYLIDHFGFTDVRAYMIYGAYTALVYVTPVFGGALADRYLGARQGVLLGACFLTFGHFLMAFEGEGGPQAPALRIFYLALAFIAVGVGFLKPNISVLVGALYTTHDKRRDAAFTLFYMGINLGGALGPLASGVLAYAYGWAWGFASAGVAMAIGTLVFIWGKPTLMGHGEAPDERDLRARRYGLSLRAWIWFGALAPTIVCWFLVQHQQAVGWLLGLSGALLVAYIVAEAVIRLDPVDRDRIFAALGLVLVAVFFWSLFEQAGSSLNVFTDRHVDRSLFGLDVPAAVFQSLNSIYIVLLGPLFAGLWTWLGSRGREPSAPAKFGWALLLLAGAFLSLSFAIIFMPGRLTPIVFIFLFYFLQTSGELCLSPVGLSAMTRLSLPKMAGLVMGMWFFANAAGNFVAALIAQATGEQSEAATQVVGQVYGNVGWASAGIGVLVLLSAPVIRKLMHVGIDEVQGKPEK